MKEKPVVLPEQQSDEALMRAITRAQDHGAFTQLVHRHADFYRSLACRMVEASEAEDIVQECFLRLWQNPGSWNPHKGVKFTTWFYRVVNNRCLDTLRKKRPQAFDEDAVEGVGDARLHPEALLSARQEGRAFLRAFAALSPKAKVALQLGYFDVMPNKGAAALMGISLKAYESLLVRAKNRLKEAVNVELHAKPERSSQRKVS